MLPRLRHTAPTAALLAPLAAIAVGGWARFAWLCSIHGHVLCSSLPLLHICVQHSLLYAGVMLLVNQSSLAVSVCNPGP
jgi:hypothetical protein